MQEVVVTGSHIARTGFTTPSPVTVIGAQSMQLLGITNVGVALSQLPSFRADLSSKTNGFANFNIGAQIANLRGLGATRTLVLVDGNRFVTSTREGSVDLNLIPTVMIARTEIVTGGASARLRLGRHRRRHQHHPGQVVLRPERPGRLRRHRARRRPGIPRLPGRRDRLPGRARPHRRRRGVRQERRDRQLLHPLLLHQGGASRTTCRARRMTPPSRRTSSSPTTTAG
ncbi:MAG: Plug domain-containing protein [Caulobacteraceae bacterium]